MNVVAARLIATVIALASLSSTLVACTAGEASESVETDSSELRNTGGGPKTAQEKCDDAWGGCYIDCSLRYPESGDSPNNLNGMLRDGCFDSCDASHRLCSPSRTLGTTVPVVTGGVLLAR